MIIKDNASKNDILDFLEELLRPFTDKYSKNDWKNTPVSFYDNDVMKLEEFSRYLLGYSIYLYNRPGENNDHLKNILDIISKGVDQKSVLYWNITFENNRNQILVEMFSILFFLYNNRYHIPDDFYLINRDNLINWFSKINNVNFSNNWLCFKLLVNVLLYKLGLVDLDKNLINKIYNEIDLLYKGNGYYCDGYEGYVDYYNSFAFHFYSLIYVKLMKNENSKQTKKFIERAKLFAHSFINWYSDDGVNVPFGRSLIYRFGVSAFWSACIYSEEDIYDKSICKNIIINNINSFLRQSIFDSGGHVTLGYYYENMNIMENYNSYGSSYWLFKTLIFLYVDDCDNIWKMEDNDYSKEKSDVNEKYIIIKQYEGESYIVPIIEKRNYNNYKFDDKYEKYIYSSLLGFNLSIDNSFFGSAFDNTISVSFDNEYFIKKYNSKSIRINGNSIKNTWYYNNIFKITTYIIFLPPWNIRIHYIDTKKGFILIDGGFPINNKDSISDKHKNIIKNENQYSGAQCLIGNGILSYNDAPPNSNVYYPKTIIPILSYKLPKGKKYICSLFFGGKIYDESINKPKVLVSGKKIQIHYNNQSIIFNFEMVDKYKKNNSQLLKALFDLKKTYKFIKTKIK